MSLPRGAVLLLAVATALGCTQESGSSSLRGRIAQVTVTGSPALHPLLLEAANRYMRGNPEALVLVSASGSPEALRELGAGAVAVAAADLAPDTGDAAELVDVPVAAVPIVVLAHRGPYNERVRSITREQLRDVASGRITSWSALGGGDQRIVFVNRSRATGERAELSRWLGIDRFVVGAPEETSGSKVQAALLAKPGALSYAALPYRHPDLDVLALDGLAPAARGGAPPGYPLHVRPHLYLRRDASPEVRAFIDFVCSPGIEADVMNPMGYVALARPPAR